MNTEIFVNIALYIGYGLLGLAAVGAILLPLINSFSNPKVLLKSVLGVVALVVIYFIAYAVAGSEVNAKYLTFGVGEEASKFIGGAIISMYIFLGIALVGILLSEVLKIVK